MKTDTIAAISTALSNSGIGIVRISGEAAVQVADKVYRSKGGKKHISDYESHTIHYGYIYDGENLIDEVMVSLMLAPKSYTTEDTVEINCHGGVMVVKKVLETVIKNGARLAEPGEFTKRAFLNGRMDLSRAEAVMDLIHSQNEFAMKSSVKQLRGSVSSMIKDLRAEILYEIAFIESALDDPEHISLDGYYEKLSEKVEKLSFRLKKLLDSADRGKILKDGISTVIVGKPNAGKSSLLNLFLGEERAIVTDIAGTTRDVLEEQIRLGDVSLNMVDTAGIRSTEDVVEKIGVERAKKYAEEADLILYVVDASVPFDENDRDILSFIKDKRAIVLLNKTDLDAVITEDMIRSRVGDENLVILRTSAKNEVGLDELEHVIQNMFLSGDLEKEDEVMLTNLRHKEAVMEAYTSIEMVKNSIADEMPEDFLSIDLMNAYTSLGMIIGEEVGDDLVTEIFSKFCMGK